MITICYTSWCWSLLLFLAKDGRGVRSKMRNIRNVHCGTVNSGVQYRPNRSEGKGLLLNLKCDWICSVKTGVITAKQQWTYFFMQKKMHSIHWISAHWISESNQALYDFFTCNQLSCTMRAIERWVADFFHLWCRSMKIIDVNYLGPKFWHAQFNIYTLSGFFST